MVSENVQMNLNFFQSASAGGASKWELVFAEVTLSKVKHAQSE